MKNGAVIIGRFNPPTVGHYNLVNKVKSYIVKKRHEHDLDPMVFIIVVAGEKSSLDHSVNPLTATERISLLAKNENCSGCKFLICTDVKDGFNKMRDAGFEPTLIAGGEDRVSGYIEMLTNFNPDRDYIEFKVERTKIDPSESSNVLAHIAPTDFKIMSASLARFAASSNNLEAFQIITGLTGEPGSKLFSKIQQRMGTNAQS